ncbi:MAG: acyl-CoA dehydrogenase family protein [Myxococcota bacterium]|nr:acyl-CoA dehydrogenase [Spirochaeta sp.]RPG10035.1 MAG: acyl-CoA dehydrogenase [Proteobacteria bacterium TMED72]
MAERNLLPEQLEFQQMAREWLKANPAPPTDIRLPLSSLEVKTQPQIDYLRDWQRRCYEAGLVGTDVPREYGGHGHENCQAIANREMSKARTPFLVNTVGLSMMVPTVLHHGTEAQKKRFIPGALSAEEIWCQGFSEPGAGSDMANQQTFASPRGDEWVVNGHKVWTSFGHFSKWMILLARTSRDHKYDGLTFFLAPIEGHPGVTVKPLVKMTGETGFNEVFFDDAVLSDDLRLDEVGKGWTVAMTTLTFERGAAEGAGGGGTPGVGIDRLIDLARNSQRNGRNAAEDPLTRDAIVQHAIMQAGLQQNARRSRVAALNDHPMRLPLQQKLVGSELLQSLSRLGVDIAGARSTLYKKDPAAPDAGKWPLSYMNSYGQTIAAGASEIQRNILGERVLGLPKSK